MAARSSIVGRDEAVLDSLVVKSRRHTSVLQRNDVAVFGITAVAVAAAAVLHFTGANDVLRFVVAAAALSLLAMNVSSGTEQVGEHLSPGATGILQSALGNLPELLVCVFSLRAG